MPTVCEDLLDSERGEDEKEILKEAHERMGKDFHYGKWVDKFLLKSF